MHRRFTGDGLYLLGWYVFWVKGLYQEGKRGWLSNYSKLDLLIWLGMPED